MLKVPICPIHSLGLCYLIEEIRGEPSRHACRVNRHRRWSIPVGYGHLSNRFDAGHIFRSIIRRPHSPLRELSFESETNPV